MRRPKKEKTAREACKLIFADNELLVKSVLAYGSVMGIPAADRSFAGGPPAQALEATAERLRSADFTMEV
jgi:hypothetical protein